MKKNRLIFILLINVFLCSISLKSQEYNNENKLFDGNKFHSKKEYINSESKFREAISIDNEKSVGHFNLGNTHFKSSNFDPALRRYFQSQKSSTSKSEKHKAFHNMGNVYMKKKEYGKAVESYKNALRNNSMDDETRYNFALAKELLEKQKQENKNSDSKNKNDKNENKGDKDSESEDKKNNDKNENSNKDQNSEKNDDSNQV